MYKSLKDEAGVFLYEYTAYVLDHGEGSVLVVEARHRVVVTVGVLQRVQVLLSANAALVESAQNIVTSAVSVVCKWGNEGHDDGMMLYTYLVAAETSPSFVKWSAFVVHVCKQQMLCQ